MPIEIKEVRTKKELKQFVRFPIKLYKDNSCFCPPLEFDELNTLNPEKNPAFEVCDHVLFLAYKNAEIVGRIAGIVNHRANKKWKVKKTRFGWIDFIDDLEVSKALFDAVKNWGKAKGMEVMNGPVGFTDFDHQGLMLAGFEYNSPMASLYNYEYYIRHFENYGLEKDIDWIEFKITPPPTIPERMERVAKLVMGKYNVKVDKVRSAKELKKKYGYAYMDVLDEAYQPLYNYSPLTDKQKRYYADMYFPMVNFDFVTIITNEKEEIVGVGVGMPNISDALRKCGGNLFPFGFIYVLRALKAKKMKRFDLLLIAVRSDYQNKGINALFFYDQIPYFNKYAIQEVETTSILETNSKSIANYELFEKNLHKRRRAYVLHI
ncbi:MAG: N-acetyltransferase [Prevotellaceae bacterium]|jgi:hypothetical protein|nr:N-acetyltransferase [Prevotellaceae bacterium]